jgi:hypothetical protein
MAGLVAVASFVAMGTSATAAATSTRAARVANAAARSLHSPNGHGGSGSGKAIGRSTAVRTARPPAATPNEKRLQGGCSAADVRARGAARRERAECVKLSDVTADGIGAKYWRPIG